MMGHNSEFDLVVWGATGSTGRRVAHNLATHPAKGDLRWAIGGRNKAKLEAVRASIGEAAADAAIVIADSHDRESLEALVARTEVVCSTVGPYAMFGSELVAACVRSGTHYCDLAAEAHWIRKMIDTHQVAAEASGARIVHACGMDSVPSDLGVFFLQQAAKERYGTYCPRIDMRITEFKGGFSGGTAGCLIYAVENKDDESIGRCMRDPYSLNPAGLREGPEPQDNMRSVEVEYDSELEAWTRPFFMGPMNTKIVRRSHALLGYPYGKDFRYGEAMLVGPGPLGWAKAKASALAFNTLIAAAGPAPTRSLMKRYVLPKPGEGPSQELRENGHWELVHVGKMPTGDIITAKVTGEGDPGTESTSRMLVESALCLAQNAAEIEVGGGSWTPASAFPGLLLARLTANAGLTFELDQPVKDAKANLRLAGHQGSGLE